MERTYSSRELFSIHAPYPKTAVLLTKQLPSSLWSLSSVCVVKEGGDRHRKRRNSRQLSRRKQNPWTEDSVAKSTGDRGPPTSGRAKRRKDAVSSMPSSVKGSFATELASRSILVSAVLPVETEVVLQTKEPASTPSWSTFVSSLRGVWKGVGAAFAPNTAEMEPIALGNSGEYLYDCRVYSTAEEVQDNEESSIHRKTIWAVGNPFGEQGKKALEVQNLFSDESEEEIGSPTEVDISSLYGQSKTADLESPDVAYDTLMEDDVLQLEPGLVFFEDGSFSRGPVELLPGDSIETALSVYKIEQCLVRGQHIRLRMVHTIAVEEEGESIQLLRVAAYEEEWMGPINMKSISDIGGHHLKLFSRRKRQLPADLTGTWKVFEMSATPIILEDETLRRVNRRPPYVYLSMETQKRCVLPEVPTFFADEDILDMQDAVVMWLPGGITAYVDIKDDRMLTIGVSWYTDGVNLVMERDYNSSGTLCEVHTKSEIKDGWVGGRM